MDNLRKGFPMTEQYTYLNTAASGLLPEPVWEFRQDHDLDFFLKGSLFKEKMVEMLTQTRETVGRFFNCGPERVGLIPNFSYGFNSILEAIDKKQKFLLLKDDYPSLNWAVEIRDFDVVYAEVNENVEAHIMEVVEKEKPDFFAFSIVQYINGLKLSNEFILKLKQKFPELMIIGDGTQYFGTEAFDFDASGYDVAMGSCYKWMNAGYGNGFMLFRDTVKGILAPKHYGFGSVHGKYKANDGTFLGKFEPGHQDTLNYGSLEAAINYIEKIGIDTIAEQINKLKNIAFKRFSEAGLLEETVARRSDHSSIFNITGDEKLFEKLRGEGIITSMRGDGIRISFHYFNTEKDLNKLFKALNI